MLPLLLLASAFHLLPWAGAGRIIGGWEAKPHSKPYMAYVKIQNATRKFRCGGFLIRPDAVLSAAHCVARKGKVNITVILGAHNIDKEEPSQQKFHVGHWVTHPNYSKTISGNDIMLLKLEPKARLTKQVRWISLASHKDNLEPGTLCNVAGWGRTSNSSKGSNVLMEVDLNVQKEKVCENSFKKKDLWKEGRKSVICAGDKNGKKATFCGDSGGPLVYKKKVHGIVSFGPKHSLFPDVFTRVSYFKNWIDEELRKF
ncbi:GRAB protein, partial [Bucco capensis]|nr:GRAB protein [Bucco capensis]